MPPPPTGRTAPAAPAWVRISVVDRQIWGIFTALLMVPIGLPLLGVGAYAALVEGVDADLLVSVVPGLVVLGAAAAFFPFAFCEQGIEVDERGLRLRKKRKWWYSGIAADLPWSEVRGLTVVRHHPGRRDRHLLVVRIDRDPGRRSRFSWMNVGTPDTVDSLTGYAPEFRYVALGRPAEVDAVVSAAQAVCPDLSVAEADTDPRRPMRSAEPDLPARPQTAPVVIDEFVSLHTYAWLPKGSRQGVRVHPGGITLMWSGGAELHLPWEDVTGIRADALTCRGRQRPRVHVHLARAIGARPLPAWASVSTHRVTGEPMLLIDPRRYLSRELARTRLAPALHEARPDLWR